MTLAQQGLKRNLCALGKIWETIKVESIMVRLKDHIDPDNPDKYPESVRFNWRGIFEKNETLITLGLYKKDGKFVVREIMYR